MALRFDRSLEPRYGVVEQITPRIRRLLAPNPGPFTFQGTGVYILGGGEDAAVIDPGPDTPEHLAALFAAVEGRKVRQILVTHTHRDHSPAALPLKDHTGATTFGFGPHPSVAGDVEEGGDRKFIPDVRVRDGDIVAGHDYTIECVFTPGHTSNHMCYALTEEAALFTGDHVMGWSTSVIAPPDGNMADYMASLAKLIARDDAVLYPTHGSPIPAPRAFLKAYLAHRRVREAQIKGCIARGLDTIPQIVARLYANSPPELHAAASLMVRAHLDHMLAENIISESDGRFALKN